MPVPTPGQKEIPLDDWKRFLRVADWFERTIEQGKGVLRPTYGAALIVKTPSGGIDARDGSTIFSATCIQCIAAETSTAGERTIHETDSELVVYNFHTTAVVGNTFIKTALSPNGTRYVEDSVLLREFELKTNLNKGSTAVAHTRHRAGGIWATDTDASAEFTVRDMHSEYIGRGRDVYSSPHNLGSYGRARLIKGEWEIYHLTPHAIHIQGLVNMGSGLLTTDSNITVDGIVICTTGGILVRGLPTTIPNTYADAADNNAPFDAFWDDSLGVDGGWRNIAIMCPA